MLLVNLAACVFGCFCVPCGVAAGTFEDFFSVRKHVFHAAKTCLARLTSIFIHNLILIVEKNSINATCGQNRSNDDESCSNHLNPIELFCRTKKQSDTYKKWNHFINNSAPDFFCLLYQSKKHIPNASNQYNIW